MWDDLKKMPKERFERAIKKDSMKNIKEDLKKAGNTAELVKL